MSKIGELIDQNKLLEQQNEELRKIIDINLSQSKPSNPVSFIETIDLNEVENLLIKFYQFNQIPIAIYGKNSQLLFSIGWKPVCVKYHHCRIGSRNQCNEFIRNIHQNNTLSALRFQCKNGLNGIAVPVNIRNTHVATIVVSQFLYEGEPINYPFFTKLADSSHFDKNDYLLEIEKLPVFNQPEIEHITNNITYLADLIGYLGVNNIETHENAVKHIDNEIILSALRNKILEQDLILKSVLQNIIHYQEEIQENTISKTELAKELAKLNQKFERTETILNSLLTSLPLGICFIRKGVFTFVNDHIYKITGYTAKELTGRSLDFLFESGSKTRNLIKYTPEYFIKHNNSNELIIRTKENKTIKTIVFSSLFDNTNPGHGWIISILDISSLNNVEKLP